MLGEEDDGVKRRKAPLSPGLQGVTATTELVSLLRSRDLICMQIQEHEFREELKKYFM